MQFTPINYLHFYIHEEEGELRVDEVDDGPANVAEADEIVLASPP